MAQGARPNPGRVKRGSGGGGPRSPKRNVVPPDGRIGRGCRTPDRCVLTAPSCGADCADCADRAERAECADCAPPGGAAALESPERWSLPVPTSRARILGQHARESNERTTTIGLASSLHRLTAGTAAAGRRGRPVGPSLGCVGAWPRTVAVHRWVGRVDPRLRPRSTERRPPRLQADYMHRPARRGQEDTTDLDTARLVANRPEDEEPRGCESCRPA